MAEINYPVFHVRANSASWSALPRAAQHAIQAGLASPTGLIATLDICVGTAEPDDRRHTSS